MMMMMMMVVVTMEHATLKLKYNNLPYGFFVFSLQNQDTQVVQSDQAIGLSSALLVCWIFVEYIYIYWVFL